MNLIGIQIISVLFCVTLSYYSYICFKKKYYTKLSYFFWVSTFTSTAFASLFPRFFSPFLDTLKISRVFDLFIIAGFFFIIAISFLNYTQIQKNKKMIEEIIQKQSLSSITQKDKQ